MPKPIMRRIAQVSIVSIDESMDTTSAILNVYPMVGRT